MSSQYQIVWKLNVFHSYFKDGTCKGLNYIPTKETKHFMKKFGLLLRKDLNGMSLYGNGERSSLDMLKYLDESTEMEGFDFELKSINPNFNLFTNLPINCIGKITFSSENPSNELKENGILLKMGFEPSRDQINSMTLSIRVKDLLKSWSNSGQVNYSIVFNSRSTLWQYFIINSSNMLFNNLSIASTAGISFEGPKEVTLPNEQKALMFSLKDKMLPFSETPEYIFKLTDKPTNDNRLNPPRNDKILISGLPNPSPERMELITLNETQVISSPMYVYV